MVSASLGISDTSKSWSFEPTGRLVHLRWAVAEIAFTLETPSMILDAGERALGIFCGRALVLLRSLERDHDALRDACYAAELGIDEVRATLGHAHSLRAERVRALHGARRKLHRALVILAEALAREGGGRSALGSSFDAPELGSLLARRQMFSAFGGSMISAGEQRSRLGWALEVAAAELSILLAYPELNDLPLRAQQAIHALHGQVVAWGQEQPEPLLGRALYREACTMPEMSKELSLHPLMLEHDARCLAELAAILANEPSSNVLETKVLGLLCALRGLDSELDRLELALIYGAPGVLGGLSLRVAELRSRVSRGRSTREAS